MTTLAEHHRPLPGGEFTCQRWGCSQVNGQPEAVERDLAQELADVRQEARPSRCART